MPQAEGGCDQDCSVNDGRIDVFQDFSRVIANVNQEFIYVNILGRKRFEGNFDDANNPITVEVSKYTGHVRLPVLPETNPLQQQNAQAAYLMRLLWDGRNELWISDNRCRLRCLVLVEFSRDRWATEPVGRFSQQYHRRCLCQNGCQRHCAGRSLYVFHPLSCF